MQLLHIREVCAVEEILAPEIADAAGWDHPPRMGAFGVVGPRNCPNCSIKQTLWWAIVVEGYTTDMLTPLQHANVVRIVGEPDSIAVAQIEDSE